MASLVSCSFQSRPSSFPIRVTSYSWELYDWSIVCLTSIHIINLDSIILDWVSVDSVYIFTVNFVDLAALSLTPVDMTIVFSKRHMTSIAILNFTALVWINQLSYCVHSRTVIFNPSSKLLQTCIDTNLTPLFSCIL